MYEANIYFSVEEDSYDNGQTGHEVNSWNDIITADTADELREKLEEATYSKRGEWNDEQINEYEKATEYSVTYLANESNEGEATASEIEQWKKGECRLFAVYCHILVSKTTKTKAEL